MAGTARFVFQVSMDVSPEKEDLFNEVYDTEHVPYLLEVPGVVSVTRIRTVDFRLAMAGEIKDVSAERGKLDWYYDVLPTNCVADWVCAGCTGAGYPDYAHCPGPEHGFKNLAVFFQACSFNSLFCQNWRFRQESLKPLTRPVENLVAAVDDVLRTR